MSKEKGCTLMLGTYNKALSYSILTHVMKKFAYSTVVLGLLVAGCSANTGSTVDMDVNASATMEADASEAMEVVASSSDAMALVETSDSSQSSSADGVEIETEVDVEAEAATGL